MKSDAKPTRTLPPLCQTTRERLGRFLDNDLNAADAGRLAGHLTDCVGCRYEYERLGEIKSTLRALPAVAPENAEKARVRVFARLERAVERGEKQGEKPSSRSTLWGGAFPVWRPAAATLTAAALIGLVFFVFPRVLTPERTGEPAVTVTLLPDAEEVSLLTSLHDAHGTTFSWDEPVARRDHSATARAHLLDAADAAAGSL